MKSIGYFEIHDCYVKPTNEKGGVYVCPHGATVYDDLGNEYPPACDSRCPHFGDLKKSAETYSVNLTCGSGKAILHTKKVKVYK